MKQMRHFWKWLYVLASSAAVLVILYCVYYHLSHRVKADTEERTSAFNQSLFRTTNAYEVGPERIKIRYDTFQNGSILAPYYLIKDSAIARTRKPDSVWHQARQTVASNRIVSFKGVAFRPYSYLGIDTFLCDVTVNNCLFGDTAMERAYSGMYFEFGGSFFEGQCEFNSNTFITNLRITGDHFSDACYFPGGNNFTNHSISFENCFMEKGADLRGLFLKAAKEFSIFPDPIDSISSITFSEDTIFGTLNLSGCDPQPTKQKEKISFYHTQLDSLDLSGTKLKDTVFLTKDKVLPIQKKKWWVSHPVWSFFFKPFIDSVEERKIAVNLAEVDLAKVDLDYSQVKLYFDRTTSENLIFSSYQQLVDKYKAKGRLDDFELADIDFHNAQGGLFNFFSKYWWYYGYKKWLIFIWSAFFIVALSLLNYIYLPQIYYTYRIDNISKAHHRILKGRRLTSTRPSFGERYLLCLIYTSIIFFGIKLDFDRLQVFGLIGNSIHKHRLPIFNHQRQPSKITSHRG